MSESMTVEQAINVVRSINEVVADKSKLSVAFNAALILSNEVERLSDANIIAEGLKEMAENFISLKKERDELRRRVAELETALGGMLDIVADSRGVAGFHLNGDTAEWDYFDEVDAANAAMKANQIEAGQ